MLLQAGYFLLRMPQLLAGTYLLTDRDVDLEYKTVLSVALVSVWTLESYAECLGDPE